MIKAKNILNNIKREDKIYGNKRDERYNVSSISCNNSSIINTCWS